MKKFNTALAVTAINVVIMACFSIAGLIYPQLILPAETQLSGGSLIFSLYLAAQTLPLAVLTLFALGRKKLIGVLVFGCLAGTAELCAFAIAFYLHSTKASIVMLVIGVLQLYATTIMRGQILQTKTTNGFWIITTYKRHYMQ